MKEFVEKATTFAEYLELVDGLLAEGKTTGPEQSEEKFQFAKLNRQRMYRLGKTIELDQADRTAIAKLSVEWVWLIITEGWCGDAAQNVPVIEKVAAMNRGIRTRYILRDENPGLMDRFLTNGSRSIPKLIVVDASTYQVLGNWGPRPQAAQDYFLELRSLGLEKPEINEKMQRWYNEDKGRSLVREFVELTRSWEIERSTKAAGA